MVAVVRSSVADLRTVNEACFGGSRERRFAAPPAAAWGSSVLTTESRPLMQLLNFMNSELQSFLARPYGVFHQGCEIGGVKT